jgi:polyisoprenoid-binding protein YceI
MGIKTTGKFGDVVADIYFDKAKLGTCKIDASIDVSTVNSENEMRDNHLKAEDYFDVAKHPKIVMVSKAFTSKGGSNYMGFFDVTIKGKTKPVEVPFTYTESPTTGLFKGSFKINRKEFGIGGNSMVLGDEATIDLLVETTKNKP